MNARERLLKFAKDDRFLLSQEKLTMVLRNNLTANRFYHYLDFFTKYNINNNIYRLAMFMAQTMHESKNWTVFSENLNYSEEGLIKTFPRYFDKETAKEYARKQEKIANRVYANRMGNGNETSGDGWKYRGRGLIQLTGKSQYMDFARHINMNLDDVCEYLSMPKGALHSACYWWLHNAKRINQYADIGDVNNVTIAINGGLNGIDDRDRKYYDCLRLLEL